MSALRPSAHTLRVVVVGFFFFLGGGVLFVYFSKFFLLEDQDRPKIHDQNVFALDFAEEETAILAAKPCGERGAASGAPAG